MKLKFHRPCFCVWTAFSLVLPIQSLRAQSLHLNIGAPNQAQGTPLIFENGNSLATNSGYAIPLRLATNGTYVGHYQTGILTPAAVGTGFSGAPAPGTQVRLRFVSVSGPAGGSFGIWDVPGFNPDEVDSTTLTISLPVGTTNGTQSILISENDGEPGADPFGHIHGRHFSATRPGLYVVNVQAYDNSTNGSGGGPIHTNSALLPIYFQAGVSIASVAATETNVAVTFATALGSTYYVQSNTNLANTASWQDTAGPFTGDNHLRSVTNSTVNTGLRFYRLRQTTP